MLGSGSPVPGGWRVVSLWVLLPCALSNMLQSILVVNTVLRFLELLPVEPLMLINVIA